MTGTWTVSTQAPKSVLAHLLESHQLHSAPEPCEYNRAIAVASNRLTEALTLVKTLNLFNISFEFLTVARH